MATAAGVRITPDSAGIANVITTSDANLTIVSVSPFVASVLVQPTIAGAAGAYVQVVAPAQGDAVGTVRTEVIAGGSDPVSKDSCPVNATTGDWYFGVARMAAGAVIQLRGERA